MHESVKDIDHEIYDALEMEVERQEYQLQMIASENYASKAVMQAQGCLMTNKYAEGYPGKRYYAGCEFVDIAENLAIDRAKKLFGAEHVNVQPHSGSQANMAVYFAALTQGDKIMGMALDHGGHLTHGSKVSFSGKFFNVVSYGVDSETNLLDYDAIMKIAKKEKPKMIISGASAYPREIDFEKFREIADEVGAYLTADIAHIAGLIAAGVHKSSVPFADFTTTTTHKTLRGPRGGMIISRQQHAKIVDKSVFPGIQGGPMMNVIAAKAVCFKEAMSEDFKNYQRQVVKNARCIAEELSGYGFDIVSGGTDNHLLLVDLRSKKITGRDAEKALQDAGIVANKNTIPFDPQKPQVTSGIRLGTPSLTTRGMRETEMRIVANIIYRVLSDIDNAHLGEKIRKEVVGMCAKFPLHLLDY